MSNHANEEGDTNITLEELVKDKDAIIGMLERQKGKQDEAEERFSRKKHDARFPKNAIAYCLKEIGRAHV